MRTYDFTPLWGSTIGFERFFDLVDAAQQPGGDDNYPPCNVERLSEDRYQIWFEGEPAARSRSFTDPTEAHAWARANQPNRPYELWSKPPGPTRRALALLKNRLRSR